MKTGIKANLWNIGFWLGASLLVASCAPNPIYLKIKAERAEDFKFYKTQSVKVITQINPSVAEINTRKKVEDWLSLKNFRIVENNSNFILIVLAKDYENRSQYLSAISNTFENPIGATGSTISSTVSSGTISEVSVKFRSLNLHLYKTTDLRKYFEEKSISINPVWEANCSTEANDMEEYERKIINTCMKAFPRSFKGQFRLRK